MATSDNDIITFIPANGDIPISDVNVLKKILSPSTKWNDSNSSLSALRDWFEQNIGIRGNANDETLTTGIIPGSEKLPVSLGRFRNNYIYGFTVQATSETRLDLYQNKNDGSVAFSGIKGNAANDAFTFTLGGNSQTQAIGTTGVTFSNLSGKVDNPKSNPWSKPGTSNNYQEYAASVRHRSTNDKIDFTIRIGYSTTSSRLIYSGTNNYDDVITSKQTYIVGTTLYKLGTDLNAVPEEINDLSALGISPSSIRLDWQPAGNADSYKVYRKNGTVWNSIGTPSTSEYTDTGLDSLTTYTYKVEAINTKGTGTSATVTGKTLAVTTPFKLIMRLTDSNLSNVNLGDYDDALLLDKYTNYSYKFKVKIIGENGFTRTGDYISRVYDTTDPTETINLTVWPANNQGTITGLIKSVQLLYVVATQRDTGATTTIGIGKNFEYAAGGIDITDVSNIGIVVPYTASFDLTGVENITTSPTSNSEVYTNTLSFDLGLDIDPTQIPYRQPVLQRFVLQGEGGYAWNTFNFVDRDKVYVFPYYADSTFTDLLGTHRSTYEFTETVAGTAYKGLKNIIRFCNGNKNFAAMFRDGYVFTAAPNGSNRTRHLHTWLAANYQDMIDIFMPSSYSGSFVQLALMKNGDLRILNLDATAEFANPPIATGVNNNGSTKTFNNVTRFLAINQGHNSDCIVACDDDTVWHVHAPGESNTVTARQIANIAASNIYFITIGDPGDAAYIVLKSDTTKIYPITNNGRNLSQFNWLLSRSNTPAHTTLLTTDEYYVHGVANEFHYTLLTNKNVHSFRAVAGGAYEQGTPSYVKHPIPSGSIARSISTATSYSFIIVLSDGYYLLSGNGVDKFFSGTGYVHSDEYYIAKTKFEKINSWTALANQIYTTRDDIFDPFS